MNDEERLQRQRLRDRWGTHRATLILTVGRAAAERAAARAVYDAADADFKEVLAVAFEEGIPAPALAEVSGLTDSRLYQLAPGPRRKYKRRT